MGRLSSLREMWTSISRRLGPKPSTGSWYPDPESMRRLQEESLSRTMEGLFPPETLALTKVVQAAKQSCREYTRECEEAGAILDMYLRTRLREPSSTSVKTAATTKSPVVPHDEGAKGTAADNG